MSKLDYKPHPKMCVESNKTSFKGGFEMSLPDSNNIQEPEDAL